MEELLNNFLFKGIVQFVYWYPALMAMMWVLGSLLFYWSNERKGALPVEDLPFVSILMPAHNEGDILYNVVEEMTKLNYPDYEIIMINDGSSDNTAEVLKKIAQTYDMVRVIDLHPNCGKANALYLGTIAAKGEILHLLNCHALRSAAHKAFEIFICYPKFNIRLPFTVIFKRLSQFNCIIKTRIKLGY